MKPGATAACLTALVLAAAGCGSGDVSPDTLAKAASRTEAVSGARTSFRATVSNPALPTPIELRGGGVVSPRQHSAVMSFRAVRGPSLPGSGLRRFGGRVVLRDLKMYMRLGFFEDRLPPGKHWLKVDLRRAGQVQGIDLTQFLQGGQDPTQTLRYLRATSGDIRKRGEEPVRGVSTTRYKATVDLRKFPATVPPSQRSTARKSVERLIALNGARKIPTEVWIDGRGLVRRQRLSLLLRTPGGGGQRVKQELEFYDFGTRVQVQAPPADEVLDATVLAGAARQPR